MKKIQVVLFCLFVATINYAGDMILSSGKYKVAFSEKEFWSSAQYFFDEVEIGNRNGFYGTILATAKNKFIGSGHTEGGVEKLLNTELIIDQKAMPVQAGEFSGDKIVFKKVSQLDNCKLTVEFILTPQEITINKQFETIAEQSIFSLYIFQFCWSEKNDQWIIERPDGTFDQGMFKSNEGWFLRGKEKEILWYALYNSNARKGILGYFGKYFPKQGTYMLWDRAVYHKFYFSATLPPSVKANFKSPQYTMILKGFDSSAEKWQETAKNVAEALKISHPLPPKAKHIEIAVDKPIELKGNGGFSCHKISLDLEKNSEYEISFQISKNDQISKIPHHTQILIGQYDHERKFHIIASLPSNQPKDGKFYDVKRSFKTPEKIFEINLYFYNSQSSDGLVKIKNITIQKKEDKQ